MDQLTGLRPVAQGQDHGWPRPWDSSGGSARVERGGQQHATQGYREGTWVGLERRVIMARMVPIGVRGQALKRYPKLQRTRGLFA
jgi:hypothetical protein